MIRMNRIVKIFSCGLIASGFVFCCGGCNVIGFLLSPSAFERKVPPVFELATYKNEKILVSVRSSQAAGVDADVPRKAAEAMKRELISKVKFNEENVINEFDLANRSSVQYGSWSEIENDARAAGAKLLLYSEIIDYEMLNLQHKNYFAGRMTIRSVLLNAETGELLWPSQSGRITKVESQLETKGRDEILSVLTSAAAHCVVREFYPCPEPNYYKQEEVRPAETIINELTE